MNLGRIDVHAHLIPGVDDGCASLEESLACARLMTAAGYTQVFATPHVWPSLKHNTCESVVHWAATLEAQFHVAGISLNILPGGELNLTPDLRRTPKDSLHTYGMAGKFALFDFWAETLPDYFAATVDWFHSLGVQPILAHPERVRAIQHQPELADEFARMGLLLQGNLQCMSDQPHAATRRTMERYLKENRYFLLGSDTHKLDTLQLRLTGLQRCIDLVGQAKIDELTRSNPLRLLPAT